MADHVYAPKRRLTPIAAARPTPRKGRAHRSWTRIRLLIRPRSRPARLLVRRRLARAGKAELAPLLLGDLASMACAAGVGGAGNAKIPPSEPDELGVLLSFEILGYEGRQPATVESHAEAEFQKFWDAGTRSRRCQYIAVTI